MVFPRTRAQGSLAHRCVETVVTSKQTLDAFDLDSPRNRVQLDLDQAEPLEAQVEQDTRARAFEKLSLAYEHRSTSEVGDSDLLC